jgi:mono/diheme cytochrome c family protein
LFSLTLTGGLLVAACGGGGQPAAADVARGHDLFKGTCATCHGPDAQGMPRLGKNLHENPFVQRQNDEALVAFLKQGRPATHPDNLTRVDMPPKGGNPVLTDDDLKAIVAYLRSIS